MLNELMFLFYKDILSHILTIIEIFHTNNCPKILLIEQKKSIINI